MTQVWRITNHKGVWDEIQQPVGSRSRDLDIGVCQLRINHFEDQRRKSFPIVPLLLLFLFSLDTDIKFETYLQIFLTSSANEEKIPLSEFYQTNIST